MSARSNAAAARQSPLRKAALVERAAPRRNPQEKDMDVNEEQEARGGVVTSYKDAPTRTVSAGGVDFAYRELGPKAGVPVIFLVHLAGVLDNWDPRVVDGIAAKHRVIAFDNRGVGASTGKTPDTIQAMAKDAVTFIRALGFDQVDLHGFSMGGMIAQVIAQDEPELVRKLILTGTGPAGGKGMKEVVWVAQVDTLRGLLSRQDPKQFLFFTRTANGKRAGKAFLARLQERTIDRDTPTTVSSYCATQGLPPLGQGGASRTLDGFGGCGEVVTTFRTAGCPAQTGDESRVLRRSNYQRRREG
jgi:pimeloyl-ACP methyl ester carboxylesterase